MISTYRNTIVLLKFMEYSIIMVLLKESEEERFKKNKKMIELNVNSL